MAKHVSLAILAEKDTPTLGRCLASVADLVDEIVVVTQPGATDSWTTQVQRFGTRLFEVPWPEDFSAARNESLKHATGDWVLTLDADEWLDEKNRERLGVLLDGISTSIEVAGYTFGISSIYADGNVETSRQVRLHQNNRRVRWKYRLHEQILPALNSVCGSVADAELNVTHDGYQDRATLNRKRARNLGLVKRDLCEHPHDAFVMFNAGVAALDCRQAASAVMLLGKSRRLRSQSPFSPPAAALHCALARAQALNGDRYSALATCCQGQAEVPDDPDLLFVEGTLRLQSGDKRAAEERLIRCTGLHSAKSAAWQVLTDLFLTDRRFNDASLLVAQLKKMPAMAVDAALAHARLLFARRDAASAIDVLRNAIATNPRAVSLHELLLTIVVAQGHPEVIPAIKRLLAIDPAHKRAQVLLAKYRPSNRQPLDK